MVNVTNLEDGAPWSAEDDHNPTSAGTITQLELFDIEGADRASVIDLGHEQNVSAGRSRALGAAWRAFTPDMDIGDVRLAYIRRYGVPPSEIRRAGPIILAGPIGGV